MKRSKEKNAFMLEYMFHGNIMKHSAGRLHSTSYRPFGSLSSSSFQISFHLYFITNLFNFN